MALHPKMKFLHSPTRSYSSSTQNNYVGAQAVAGRRGTLPTFNDGNTYYVASTGSDSAAGTSAAPFKTLDPVTDVSLSLLADLSGNSRDLTQVGTVPHQKFPCYPIPPTGKSVIGPFNDSDYLTMPAAVLNGRTSFTIEMWLWIEATTGTSQQIISDSVNGHLITIETTGTVTFRLSPTSLTTTATLQAYRGSWYYLAFVYTSALAGGKQIWGGPTPETATLLASATQTLTPTWGVTNLFKYQGGAGQYYLGMANRLCISSAARTSFPTTAGMSNIQGLYTFTTAPLLRTANKPYVVLKDSAEINGSLFLPYKYDLDTTNCPSGLGVYAADGETPTIKMQKGAKPNTYGVNNAARVAPAPANNYYIDKVNGNDGTGARNNAGLPFKTIQAALSNGSRASGDGFKIVDSSVYQEDLTLGTLACTIYAASGKAPTIRAVTTSSTSKLLTAGANVTYAIDGILLDGGGSLGTLYGITQSTFTFTACSIRGFGSVGYALSTILVTFTDCNISSIPSITATHGLITMVNCYFSVNTTSGAKTTSYFGSMGCSLTQCTFVNATITSQLTVAKQYARVLRCMFINASFNSKAAAALGAEILFTSVGDSLFLGGNCLYDAAVGATHRGLICYHNNFQTSSGSSVLPLAFGFKVDAATAGTPYIYLKNCVASNNTNNFYIAGVAGSYSMGILTGNTSLGGITNGLNSPDLTTNYGNVFAHVDAGSATPYTGGVAPSSWFSGSVIGSATGAENCTLQASDVAVLNGVEAQLDAGYDWANAVIPLSFAVTLDGLTFAVQEYTLASSIRTQCQEGGILANGVGVVTVKFCTFDGIGASAINLGSSAVVSGCYINSIGNGVKLATLGQTISTCVGNSLPGTFILNGGQAGVFSHNSSYGCSYGQYDTSIATVSSLIDSIYSGSGNFDYSGSAAATYCCIGTLDMGRSGSIDSNSIQNDPLYRAPVSGDFSLMAIARGDLFSSPVIGISSTANDLGAYDFTYGSATETWIEIDLASISPAGANYRNPDKVERELISVQLAESERGNGVFDSGASAYKTQYGLTWGEACPMPLEQLIEFMDMFKSSTNEIKVQMDGAWISARLVRGEGFSYSENSEIGYTADDIPMPLAKLIFREA